MQNSDLQKKIARLETLCDHLMTELGYIDNLMKSVGFAGGLETVKHIAKELYELEKAEELE